MNKGHASCALWPTNPLAFLPVAITIKSLSQWSKLHLGMMCLEHLPRARQDAKCWESNWTRQLFPPWQNLRAVVFTAYQGITWDSLPLRTKSPSSLKQETCLPSHWENKSTHSPRFPRLGKPPASTFQALSPPLLLGWTNFCAPKTDLSFGHETPAPVTYFSQFVPLEHLHMHTGQFYFLPEKISPVSPSSFCTISLLPCNGQQK